MSEVTATDLFGEPVKLIDNIGAYAGRPGAGPAGKTCRECAYYSRVDYHGKTYRKCGKIADRWTHGSGTDIKARTPACQFFEDGGG